MNNEEFVRFLVDQKGFLPVVCCGFCTGAINPENVALGQRLEQTCGQCGNGFVVGERDGKKTLISSPPGVQ